MVPVAISRPSWLMRIRAGQAPWPIIMQASAIWLASRVAFIVFTYFFVAFTQPGAHPPSSLLANWERWDAAWYINIARHGYFEPQAAAFFPLFPGLTRLLSPLFGGHLEPAAVVVANLGSLAAFIGIGLLAANERWTAASAPVAIMIAATYPFAFFTIVPYAEGLLFGLVALNLYFARRRRWRAAAITGFLCALSRPTGIIVFLPLLWEYGRDQRWWQSIARRQWLGTLSPRRMLTAVAVIGAVPAGLGAYMLYLWRQFGDPLLFIHAQERYWGRDPIGVISTVRVTFENLLHTPPWTQAQALELSALLPVLAFGILTVVMIRRAPFSFTLLMAGLLFLTLSAIIPASTEKIESAGRELLVAVPMFVMLGGLVVKRVGWQMFLMATGLMVQAVFAGVYLSTGWIA
jgi:hypothetical protein